MLSVIEYMSDWGWQTAINVLITLLLAVVGWGLNWIRLQVKQEFDRIDKRIDQLREDQRISAKEARTDHVTCRESLSERFVPRNEYTNQINTMMGLMSEIREDLREIRESIASK